MENTSNFKKCHGVTRCQTGAMTPPRIGVGVKVSPPICRGDTVTPISDPHETLPKNNMKTTLPTAIKNALRRVKEIQSARRANHIYPSNEPIDPALEEKHQTELRQIQTKLK